MALNYAFPNVSVTEDIIGPISINPGYRHTIGVAGVFKKGPAGAVFLNNRSDIKDIYGEDDSSGSIFIRTAMQQGATDFVISRVLPSAKFGEGLLYLQAGVNPSISEAVTDSSSNRTVGLKLLLSYIGTPDFVGGSVIGAPVTVDKTNLNLPGFDGAAAYDFTIKERIDNSTVTPTPATITIPDIVGDTNATVRKVTVTGGTAAAFIAAAKPGTVLTTTAVGITFGSDSGANLEVLTYPVLQSAGVWSVLVKGQVTGTLGLTTAVSVDPYASTGVYFIVSYNSRTASTDLLPSNLLRNVTHANATIADGFLVVKATDKSSQFLMLTTLAGGVYSQLNTNIKIAIGDNTLITPTELVINSNFTVSIIQALIQIGENNSSAIGFPDTAKAFGYNVSASEILYQLQVAISNSQSASRLINDYEIGLTTDVGLNTETLPYTLTLKAKFTGEESNRIYFNLDRTYGGVTAPDDVLFGASGSYYGTNISFENGKDALKYASTYFYDSLGTPLVLVQALSAGSGGNNIKVSVKSEIRGQFRLEVTDTSIQPNGLIGKSETYILNNNSVDPSTGFYSETIDSKLIRAFFVPVAQTGSIGLVSNVLINSTPQRVAPPLSVLSLSSNLANPLHPSHRGAAYLQNIYLSGGDEPSTNGLPTEEDYINAVAALENEDVAFIAVDNLYVTDSRYQGVHSELIAQAERSTTQNGLRLAVLACPPRMTRGRVKVIKGGVNSARIIFVAGWTTFSNSINTGYNNVSPVGHYVGKLAKIPPHISPASISEAGSLNSVLTVDHLSNPDYLNELTINGIDAIFYDTSSKSYKILNGRNSDTNSSDFYISIRRQADQIIQDLFTNLQWARSAKNDANLRSRVASSVDTYLDTKKTEGRISGFVPTIADSSNNTALTISRGELNIRVVWTPVYPADYIKVTIVRDVTAELTLAL